MPGGAVILRGRHRTIPPHLLATFLRLSVLLSLCFAGGCKWFPGKGRSEAERREIVIRFGDGIERAGGPGVWVKGFRSRGFPPGRAGTAIQVVAVPSSFNTVVSTMRAQSRREGLDAEFKGSHSRAGRRALEIVLMRRGELVSRWHLREIPQLCRAAIVIDDLGQDPEVAQKLLELRFPLTFSILPRQRHSLEIAEEAHRAGREVMLHLPMEPEPGSRATAGDGAIRVGMSPDEVTRVIQADLISVPHAVGVNNHMGSRATADANLMAAVIKVLAEHRLYFVDSRTTAASVALDLARRQGLPAFYRSVFLDGTETTAYTLGQLRQFRRVVEEQGAALAIGHPYPTTLAALAQFLPEVDRDDIQLVSASEIVHLPEVARLAPPAPSHHPASVVNSK